MDVNTELLKLLDQRTEHYIALELYRGLVNQWPQINPTTRLELTEYREVSFASLRALEWPPPKSWQNARGRKARVWRALGELFNRPRWKRRGMIYAIDPTVPRPEAYETVTLERYGVTSRIGESAWIDCAYYPRTDTLYIRGNTLVAHATGPESTDAHTP